MKDAVVDDGLNGMLVSTEPQKFALDKSDLLPLDVIDMTRICQERLYIN